MTEVHAQRPVAAADADDVHEPGERPRRKPFENQNFKKFWIGETVSLFGSQVTVLALPLTAVLVLDVDAKEMGFLQFVQFISFGILAMPLGVWADRRRKMPIMISTNVVRAVLIALVPLLSLFDVLTLNALYAIALAGGVCTVLFDVCWMSFVPVLVQDKDELVEANGKLGMSLSAAQLAGPSLGGILVQILTAPFALVLDALTYVVSAVTLSSIGAEEPAPAPRRQESTLWFDLGEGVRWVLGHPYLRLMASVGALYNFFFMFVQSVFLLFAVRTLSLSSGVIGVTLSAGAVGGLLGAGIAGRVIRRYPLGRVYQVASVVGLASFLLLPVAAGPRWVTTIVLVSAFLVMSFGLSIANVVSVSLRQAITPSSLMARMNAAMRTLMFGLGSFGALAGGFLGETVGLHNALWIAAVGAAASTTPLFVSSMRRLTSLPASAQADS